MDGPVEDTTPPVLPPDPILSNIMLLMFGGSIDSELGNCHCNF